ncbi:hypothetical protein SynBIOSE41_01260 [Synechococcus sp. BIOS-E4-1]|nr:hypothetical protein SynBIOSE41_01260 [Synechococcus sp. BIOS-E4-1]
MRAGGQPGGDVDWSFRRDGEITLLTDPCLKSSGISNSSQKRS